MVEVAAAPPVDIVGKILQKIKALGDAEVPTVELVASHILVVDDNPSNRDLLTRRLGREGYRVTAAECGISAIALTATEDFDLILLDLIMPDLSGFEVLCRLKAQESTRDIPVIMISALDELDSTVRCIAAGAEDYLRNLSIPFCSRPVSALVLKKSGCSTSCALRRSVLRLFCSTCCRAPSLRECGRVKRLLPIASPRQRFCFPISSISPGCQRR